MADEVFKQSRKKISPEDLGNVPAQPESNPFEYPNVDPIARARQVQEAVAQEFGEEMPMQHAQPFKSPDSPFQIGGQMPPELQRAIQQQQQRLHTASDEEDEVPQFPSQFPPQQAPVQQPKPKARPAAQPQVRAAGSDALEAALAKLGQTWETVELPSKGKFYDNIPGVLHIRAMTGEEEQILATPRHVRKGKAIDMIFQKCIREQINPAELLSSDRTYLLIYLRGISYTPEYDVEIKCPECSTKFNTVIDLNSLEVELCTDEFSPNDLAGTLPKSGLTYQYHLASGEDELAVTRYRESRIREYGDTRDDDTLLYRTALLLDFVEGITDKNELNLLLKRLPIVDVAHLRNTINDPPFGVDTEIGIICPSCSAEFEIDLPLESGFFFPGKKKDQTRA